MMNIAKNIEAMCCINVNFNDMICNSDGHPLHSIEHHKLCILYHPEDISDDEVRSIINSTGALRFLECANSGDSLDNRSVVMHSATFESFKQLLMKQR